MGNRQLTIAHYQLPIRGVRRIKIVKKSESSLKKGEKSDFVIF
jgi:hypothetical protein